MRRLRGVGAGVLAAAVAGGAPAAGAAELGFHVFGPCLEVDLEAEDVTGRPPITISWLDDEGRVYPGNPIRIDTADYTGLHSIDAIATSPYGTATRTLHFLVEELELTGPVAEQNPVPGLTATVTGGLSFPAEWRWSWGDGTSSPWSCDLSDPSLRTSHAYTVPGTYSVRLHARNCRGTIVSAPLAVTVGEPDAIEIEVFEAQGCAAGFCVFGTGEAIGFEQEFSAVPSELRYDWDGDGVADEVSAGVVAEHAYPLPGVYRPVLTAVRGGQEDTEVHEMWLLISGAPVLVIFEDGFESGGTGRWSRVVESAAGP